MAAANAMGAIATALARTRTRQSGDDELATPNGKFEPLRRSLRPAIRYWSRSGLLVPMPVGAGLLPPHGPQGVDSELTANLRAIVRAVEEEPGGAARAMVVLTGLLLTSGRQQRSHVTRIPVLFEDDGNAEGVSGILEIWEYSQGPAGLFPDPEAMGFARADSAFTESLSRAWAYALGAKPASGCFVWRLTIDDGSPVDTLGSASLGAPLAIALREIVHRRPAHWILRPWASLRGLRPRCAVTGAIAADGALTEISGMPAKLKAASDRHLRLVAPAANQAELVYRPSDVRVYWAGTVESAARYAHRWRPFRTGIVAVLVLILVGAMIAIRVNEASNQALSEQRLLEQSAQLAAQSEQLDSTNPPAAALLAAQAWRTAHTVQAYDSLLDAYAQPQHAILQSSAASVGAKTMAISPDGELLATGGWDSLIHLWDVASRELVGHAMIAANAGPGGVSDLTFSPDGKLLASAAHDGTARIFNVATGHQVGHPIPSAPHPYYSEAEISSVSFSSDSKVLATAGANGLEFWNIKSERPIGSPIRSAGRINWVRFSPDGSILATGDSRGIRFWNAITHQQIGAEISGPTGHAESVDHVAFNPAGTALAAIDNAGVARLWNVATRRQIGLSMATGAGDGNNQLSFSPDGSLLALADQSDNDSAQLWNVETQSRVDPALGGDLGGAHGLAFEPHSDNLAISDDNDGAIRIFDLDIYRALGPPIAYPDDLSSVTFSPNGKLIVTEGTNAARFWNVVTRRQVGLPIRILTLPGDVVGDVEFSPDGTVLATVSGDMQLWRVATRHEIGAPLSLPGEVNSVAFDPRQKLLATVEGDGQARLWNLTNDREVGRAMKAITNAGASADTLQFNPSGNLLATGSDDGTIQIWTVATQRAAGPIMRTSVGTGGVSGLAFSPDGKILATAGNDGTVRFWNVATHRQVGQPLNAGANGYVSGISFSRRGTFIATADEGIIRIWDVASRNQIGPNIDIGPAGVGYLSFSPSTDILGVAGAATNGVQLWSIQFPARLLDSVCSIARLSRTYAQSAAYRQAC